MSVAALGEIDGGTAAQGAGSVLASSRVKLVMGGHDLFAQDSEAVAGPRGGSVPCIGPIDIAHFTDVDEYPALDSVDPRGS